MNAMEKNITNKQEISVAKMLIAEQIEKDKKRREYMRKYYQERKDNGFIKSSKRNAIRIKNKKFLKTKLIVERGNFIVSFD
mgnify:CR=1 FL=1|tara:strand:+ start:1412 stop:1654 length:243 start_codon:yes stop_codon:yes gene_type:complete